MKYSKITISGKICTGKTTLFWGLQEHLNWPTFSTSQFFRDFARSHNFSIDEAEEQNRKLTIATDKRVRDLLKKDINVIVEGWMAGIMANNNPSILRILLVCDDEKRIKRYAKRENVCLKEAREKVKSREENWLNKLKRIYKRNDIFDPKHYDLVIDTTKNQPKKILNQVLRKLKG